MQITGTLFCSGTSEFAIASCYDSALGKVFASTEETNGQVLRIDAPSFSCDGAISDFEIGIGYLLNPICDPANSRAYFASGVNPFVARFDTAAFAYIDYLEYAPDASASCVLAQDDDFVYAISNNIGGDLTVYKISKILWSVVDTLVLVGKLYSPKSATVDESDALLFIGTGEAPCVVVKINLATFAFVSEAPLSAGQNGCSVIVAYQSLNELYIVTTTDPPIIIKLDYALGALGSIVLSSAISPVSALRVDEADNYAVVCGGAALPFLSLLDVSSFSVSSSLLIGAAGDGAVGMELDIVNDLAYITAYTYSPAEFYRVTDFLLGGVDHLPLMGVH